MIRPVDDGSDVTTVVQCIVDISRCHQKLFISDLIYRFSTNPSDLHRKYRFSLMVMVMVLMMVVIVMAVVMFYSGSLHYNLGVAKINKNLQK